MKMSEELAEELVIPGTETYAERVARVFGSLGPQNQEPKGDSEDDSRSNLQQFHRQHGISESRRKTGSSQRWCDHEELEPSHMTAKPRRLYTHRVSMRYVPDYMKHPERWVKYDLKNDGTERMAGMSADLQNKAAALEFLKMRTGSVTKQTENTVDTGTTGTVKFKKPELKLPGCNTPLSAYQEVTCNNMMKEYVVGAKREKKLKRTQQPVDHVSSVHLSHLEDQFSDY